MFVEDDYQLCLSRLFPLCKKKKKIKKKGDKKKQKKKKKKKKGKLKN
jgi:hypothetical protein